MLGAVRDGKVHLSLAGQLTQESWCALPERFPQLVLDEFVVMPNHFHAIVAIVWAGLASPVAATTKNDRTSNCSLPSIVGAFKSISTIKINRLLKRSGHAFWQRSYYEHIIRDSDDMKNTQRYILENPMKWCLDPEHPESQIR